MAPPAQTDAASARQNRISFGCVWCRPCLAPPQVRFILPPGRSKSGRCYAPIAAERPSEASAPPAAGCSNPSPCRRLRMKWARGSSATPPIPSAPAAPIQRFAGSPPEAESRPRPCFAARPRASSGPSPAMCAAWRICSDRATTATAPPAPTNTCAATAAPSLKRRRIVSILARARFDSYPVTRRRRSWRAPSRRRKVTFVTT